MMATISNNLCFVIHRNMIHRFRVQVLQNPPFCSSTLFSTGTIWWLPSTASWKTPWTVRTGRVLGLIRKVGLNSPPSWIMCATPTPVGCEAALPQLYCSTSRFRVLDSIQTCQQDRIPGGNCPPCLLHRLLTSSGPERRTSSTNPDPTIHAASLPAQLRICETIQCWLLSQCTLQLHY
jgi:hypothetical protein